MLEVCGIRPPVQSAEEGGAVPFTPSHAVVALPFLRTPLVPAAIAIGSMAPDLPLFVRIGTPGYSVTHQFAWLPATVLLALGLFLVWRLVLRPTARELLPDVLARRLPPSWDQSAAAALRETFVGARGVWPTSLLLAASLAIGVVSHLAWDGFTHEGRFGTELVPALDARWGSAPATVWLQNASSTVGLLVLAVAAAVWFVRAPAGASPTRVLPAAARRALWAALPVMLLVAATAGAVVFWHPPVDAVWAERVAYRVLPPTVALWGALLIAACATTLALRARARQPTSSGPTH